jgi:hypothetical protein
MEWSHAAQIGPPKQLRMDTSAGGVRCHERTPPGGTHGRGRRHAGGREM